MENMTKEQAIEKCSYCGWLRKDHKYGYCYHYSDEDTDYFHNDKKFVASGSVAAPKEEERCSTCGEPWGTERGKVCSNSFHLQSPHFTRLKSELTTLRQQLKEREEVLKELLPIAQWGYDLLVPFDKERMGKEWPAIIERARKLILK